MRVQKIMWRLCFRQSVGGHLGSCLEPTRRIYPLSLVTYSHLFRLHLEVGASCSTALMGWDCTGYPRVSHGFDQLFRLMDSFSCLPIWSYTVIRILRPSSRIFTAALTSLSILFPHSQRYTRSLSSSSFFIVPHLLHILLDGKKRSTFTSSFPPSSSLYVSISWVRLVRSVGKWLPVRFSVRII